MENKHIKDFTQEEFKAYQAASCHRHYERYADKFKAKSAKIRSNLWLNTKTGEILKFSTLQNRCPRKQDRIDAGWVLYENSDIKYEG